MTQLKFNKLKYLIIFLLVLGLLQMFYFYNKKQKIKISFPFTMDVSSNTSFACESLLYSGIFASSEKYLIGGIEGHLEKGTDKVAMTIKDQKTLEFTTAASVGIGISKGDDFTILYNDNEKLLATWFNDIAVHNIILNKKNGLAVWLKGSQSTFLDAPNGHIIYLICR